MAHLIEPGVGAALLGLGADLMVAQKAASSDEHYRLMVRRSLSNYDAHLFKAGFENDGVTKVASAPDITKAMSPQIVELTKRLERVESMARPGGPALRPAQRPQADPKEELAEQYRRHSAMITDPTLARGYRDRADEIATKG